MTALHSRRWFWLVTLTHVMFRLDGITLVPWRIFSSYHSKVTTLNLVVSTIESKTTTTDERQAAWKDQMISLLYRHAILWDIYLLIDPKTWQKYQVNFFDFSNNHHQFSANLRKTLVNLTFKLSSLMTPTIGEIVWNLFSSFRVYRVRTGKSGWRN